MASLIWFILVVGFGVLEAGTAQLVSIWFAGGAFCSLIASLITDNIFIQITIFIVSSIILLILTKPIVRKLYNKKDFKTNFGSLIGKTTIITQDVDNDLSTGETKIDGKVWSVKSLTGEVILKGEKAIIDKIEGVKLIVKRS